MNRQTKRLMARQQGQAENERGSVQKRVQAQKSQPESRRLTPRAYIGEVRDELLKVNWPSRKTVVNYSSVVLVTLIVLISLIFLLNLVFSRAVLFLFG